MKSFISILTLGVIVAAFIAGLFYGHNKQVVPVPQQLTLEKILSIKELHLVKHTYTDLFFLHKQNDKSKAIRAIVQIPITVTAYLDLKKIELVKQGDTIREVLLPRAIMNKPNYMVEQMVIRETRSMQFYIGKDLYPKVGQYIQDAIANRMDTVYHMALTNRIVAQAEEEGKEYIINVLRELNHPEITVRFVDENTKVKLATRQPASFQPSSPIKLSMIESIPFGFVPL